MQVVDDSTQYAVGMLDDPLIEPDTGKIAGFFVQTLGLSPESTLFLNVLDITQWGTKVHIAREDVLSPPGELVRMESAMQDPRTMLGQQIRIRPGGITIGRCVDVQFDTKRFVVEWMFPRRWFFMRDPVATTEIIEITRNAIWVKPPIRPVTADVKRAVRGDPAMEPAVGAVTMQD